MTAKKHLFNPLRSNLKSPLRSGGFLRTPMITSEMEPMSDIAITDKEVKIVIETFS